MGLEDNGISEDFQGTILKHAGHTSHGQTFQSSDALSSAEGYSWTKKGLGRGQVSSGRVSLLHFRHLPSTCKNDGTKEGPSEMCFNDEAFIRS